ncbi:MAG: hypothetical protein ACE5HE_00555 [Phycisphaerae bacterium]
MFGHHSGSGGFSLLWLLASLAMGASFSSTQCSRAQGQPIALSLGRTVLTHQGFEETAVGDQRARGGPPCRAVPLGTAVQETKALPGFLTGLFGYEGSMKQVGIPNPYHVFCAEGQSSTLSVRGSARPSHKKCPYSDGRPGLACASNSM